MRNDPYRHVPKKPVTFKTTADFSRREQCRKLPQTVGYLEDYLDGSYFTTAHSLGEIAGLSQANTTRLGGGLANYSRSSANTIGSLFALPTETVLFYAVDRRPKTTRQINICTVAAVTIFCSEKPHAPMIAGVGCNIIQPLLEGLVSHPEETQQSIEKLSVS